MLQRLVPRRFFSLSKLERRLVWIMGSPRTGSTWLADLIADDSRCVRISEPLIGMHLGIRATAIAHAPERQMVSKPRLLDLRTDEHYFFAPGRSDTWEPMLRQLILQRFSAYRSSSAQVYLVHEPNGSDGADVIMRVLPKSRLLFLMRDGRDVVDSILDSYQTGSWLDSAFGVGRDFSSTERLTVIEAESYRWLTRTRIMQKAFNDHAADLRMFVRYEDLLRDTYTEFAQILDWMGLVQPSDLEDRIKRHSFNAIPKAYVGSAKFHRAASPGLWRDGWTEEEKRLCSEILDPTLRDLGYMATDS